MGVINKNALVSISKGNAVGFSKIRFNIPEEMRFAFPISELFKMEVIGFNIEKIEFKEEPGKHLILMNCNISRTALLAAVFSFAVHIETYTSLKELLTNTPGNQDVDDETIISSVKKVVESYPPIIQIIPKMNMH